MSDLEKFKAFADKWIPELAQAIRDADFSSFCRPFDPEMDDDFSEQEFIESITEEQDGLGYLEEHKYLGHVKGSQERYPGCIRFVYSGVFTQSEGLIICCVHERDGQLYMNEHVYYWD